MQYKQATEASEVAQWMSLTYQSTTEQEV